MAVNPITSDDLTIDLASLLSLSVSDRVQAAASDPGFAQALMQSLTPIQLAKAFPDYYRRELPDISNFILANRYLDSGGRFDQYGDGDYGEHKDMHSGGATLDNTARPLGVPTPTLEEMKAKLLEKGIDVDNIYKSVSAEGISIDDEKVKVLKNLSSDQLTKMGFEQFEDDSGKKKIRLLPTETASLSDEQIIKRAESRRLDPNKFMDPMTSGKLRPEIVSKYQGKRLPVSIRNNNMGAISLKDDSNTFVTGMPGYLDKTERPANEGGYYARYATPEHGVAAASRNLENYGKKGITSPAAIVKTWAEDGNQNYINTVVKYLNDAGYEVNQNSTLDLTDPKVRMAILKGKSAFESGAGMPVYTDEVFETGVNYTFESPIDPNKQYTPEEIKELRKKDEQYQISQRQDDAVRSLYNLPSPTSSDFQSIGTNQIVNIDEDVMLGNKPFIDGNEFAVPIYTSAKGGQVFDENLAGLTPQAVERLKQQAIAAKAAGITRLEISGAQTHEGHASHGAGTETDLIGYNEDGSMWNRDQRATTALGAIQLGGANRAGFYGSGRVLHTGKADEVEGGPRIESAWGPGGKTAGVSVEEFTPGLEREIAAYLKGQGPMPQSPVLNEHLKKMEEAKLAEEKAIADSEKRNTAELTPTQTTKTPEIQSFQFGGIPDVQDDEDLTAVDTEGKPKFKFNSGEGLYVKPESNEYADDKIDELSNRIDKMTESKPESKQRDMPISNQQKSDPRWAEKVASAYRPSGTQQRAFNRAQFRSEGRHVGDRGSPNIA